MGIIIGILVGGIGMLWLSNRLNTKNKANFRARVLSTFTGVWPVFPYSPYDETVDARAAEIANGFVEHGNQFPKYVQKYYYNDVIKDANGNEKSTASLDWQNCLVLYMHDYLRRVEQFHAEQHAKSPTAAAEFLAGQKQSMNTL